MDYQVNLEVFRGPLDLLLFLVKRNEVDIFDIPVARLTEQYLEYLGLIEMIDVEHAGDFLVMAATLMEIKSKLLLPHGDDPDAQEADPRLELVRQLIEYKKFKDAANLLEAQAERQLSRLARQEMEPAFQPDPAQQPLRQVELWDLVSAFGRLMRETLALQPQQIIVDQTPMQVHMDWILQQLDRQPRLAFSALFTAPYQRSRLVGLFLAILELIRAGRIAAEQGEVFGELWISAAPQTKTAEDAASPPSGN
jgi:segregation and condensation protein A